MAKKTTCIDVRTAEGKRIFSLYLYEKEINSNTDQSNGESPMTEAQKKYLFRILGEQGFEGEEGANQHLKELFGVESLDEVNKLEAHKMIESLLEKAESK